MRWVCVGVLSGLAVTPAGVSAQQQPAVAVWNGTAEAAPHPQAAATVDGGWKLIGGGARANGHPDAGSLLTATRPNGANWDAAAKDHFVADPATVDAFAIGLSDPGNAWEMMVATGGFAPAARPIAQATLPPGWVMTGGGCWVDWQGGPAGADAPGNLLTASYPAAPDTWQCRSQEHTAASPAGLVAYVVGIRPRDGRVPLPEVRITSARSEVAAHPTATASGVAGFVMTGGGALATTGDPGLATIDDHAPADEVSIHPAPDNVLHPQGQAGGQFLTESDPVLADGTQVPIAWRAASKDHIVSSPGTVEAFAVNVRFHRPLTVVAVNQSGAWRLDDGATWATKNDRLGDLIKASGEVPDFISLTESNGWTWCLTPPWDISGDYDLVDRLISRLQSTLSVTYRVAYLVGAEGSITGGRCTYFSGDTLLYNPSRIFNLTPDDVASQPTVAHDDTGSGMRVRRSLPLCNRGASTKLPGLAALIDGPPQTDKCGRSTPSAPAWTWLEAQPDGSLGLVASVGRFRWADNPESSFDVATVHPNTLWESLQYAPIQDFLTAVASPPYRTTRPTYPMIVLGDFNCLSNDPPYRCNDTDLPLQVGWPPGTAHAFKAPEDVMVIALGDVGSLKAVHGLNVIAGRKMPAQEPCRPAPGVAFSDHCGLVVRFSDK